MRTTILILVALSTSALHAQSSWPQFRGPTADGMSSAASAALHWNETENVRWKAEIPGQGWSSPVSDGKLVWMTTAMVKELSKEEQDRIRAEKYSDHMIAGALVIVDSVDFRAIGVEAESGKVLHDIGLFSIDNPVPVHSLNSYASPTPVLHEGRLFCHFGSYGTVCIDAESGAKVWSAKLEHNESVGPGSSPTIVDKFFLVACDGTDDQFVVALDIDTGEEVWRTDRPSMEGNEAEYHKCFSTPILIESGGKRQAVILGAQWIASYDPSSGAELWRARHGSGFSNAILPLYDGKHVIFTTGFAGNTLMAVDPSGKGDVTDTHVAWTYKGRLPTMSSPILVGGHVYFVSDQGVAECVDVETGKRIWKKRLGGNYCSSPIHAAGNIYFSNREGETVLIAAAEEFEEVARNQLPGSIMASLAMLEEDLLIRTDAHLYRIKK